MLTLSASFKAAIIRNGVTLRHLVTITDGTSTWKFTDGPCLHSTMTGYNPGVFRVDSFAAEFDPKTHESKIGRISIAMQDASLRSIVENNRVRGMKVSVALGEESLAESSFVVYYTGFVISADPEPNGNVIMLEVLSTWSIVQDTEIVGAWIGTHPLENIEDILDNRIALDSSLFDASSFDPSSYADVSHLATSRFSPYGGWDEALVYRDNENAVWSPEKARKLINDNLQIVDGVIVPGTDGKLKYVHFDPSASAVANWDNKVIGELSQLDNWDNMVNDVIVEAYDGYHYQQGNTDSQTAHAFAYMTYKKVTENIDNPWIKSSIGRLHTGYGITAGQTALGATVPPGWCGFRESWPYYLQPADARPLSEAIVGQTEADYDNSPTTEGTFAGGSGHAASDVVKVAYGVEITVDAVDGGGAVTEFTISDEGSGLAFLGETLTQTITSGSGTGFSLTPDVDNLTLTRPLYWMVIDPRQPGYEIIKITTMPQAELTFGGKDYEYGYSVALYVDPSDPATTLRYKWVNKAIVKAYRGQLGTSALSFGAAYPINYPFIVDITAQVYMAERILDRFEHAPRISLTTSLSEFAVEPGDLVTIEWPAFIAYGANGIDNTTKWQITAKEVDVYASTPQIRWTAVRATTGTSTRAHRVWSNSMSSAKEKALRTAIATDGGLPKIGDRIIELLVSAATGLTVDITGGRIMHGGNEYAYYPVEALSLTASMDSYIYANLLTGGLTVTEVSLGGTAPVRSIGLVPLAKVVTGAAAVSSVTDLRPGDTQTSVPSSELPTGVTRVPCGLAPNGDFADWSW